MYANASHNNSPELMITSVWNGNRIHLYIHQIQQGGNALSLFFYGSWIKCVEDEGINQ